MLSHWGVVSGALEIENQSWKSIPCAQHKYSTQPDLLPVGKHNFQTGYKGVIRIEKSSRTFGTFVPTKYALRLKQLLLVLVGSHAVSMGVHWNIAGNRVAMPHAIVRPIRTKQT